MEAAGPEAIATGEGFHGVCLPRRHGVSQCVFEHVYFSRPDSRVFGVMVDKVRRRLGKQMAVDAPVPEVPKGSKRPIVMAVPDSSNTAAIGYVSQSNKLGRKCKLDIGLIRNHYVGRTFISPGQSSREQKVRTKFNPVRGVLEGRVVVMVDDSIVRGTTARQLVRNDQGGRASPRMARPLPGRGPSDRRHRGSHGIRTSNHGAAAATGDHRAQMDHVVAFGKRRIGAGIIVGGPPLSSLRRTVRRAAVRVPRRCPVRCGGCTRAREHHPVG